MQVAIVGAGLMGRLLGWQLTCAGNDVHLFERSSADRPESAAYVAAAMLAPVSELPEAAPEIYALGQRSLELWPAILNELGVHYGFTGSIFVAHGNDGPLLDKYFRSVQRKADGLAVHWLDSTDIKQLEPELAHRFPRGLYLPGEGWLDNRGLLAALESRCGTMHYDHAVQPDQCDADLVLDCRGSGSDDPDLRAVRGEVIRVRAPEVRLTRPIRLMHPRYQIYVVPRRDQEYVIGATQVESSASQGVAVRSALELLSAAFTVHSGFAEAEILELNVGLRPAYADHRPRISWRGGVLHINGLYRHGFLLAPALALKVQDEISRTSTDSRARHALHS